MKFILWMLTKHCLVFSIQLFIAYKYDNAINKRSDYLTDPFNAYSMPINARALCDKFNY